MHVEELKDCKIFEVSEKIYSCISLGCYLFGESFHDEGLMNYIGSKESLNPKFTNELDATFNTLYLYMEEQTPIYVQRCKEKHKSIKEYINKYYDVIPDKWKNVEFADLDDCINVFSEYRVVSGMLTEIVIWSKQYKIWCNRYKIKNDSNDSVIVNTDNMIKTTVITANFGKKKPD